MKVYEVQFGFELPFWLALPEGECTVAVDANTARLSVSNAVDRWEVGDPDLLPGMIIQVLSPQETRDETREQLRREHQDIPVTRHSLKTLVTHVREVICADEEEVKRLYDSNKRVWYDESLKAVNRLIDAYQSVVPDDALRGHAAQVAPWDMDRFVTSLWDTDPRRQLTGSIEPALPEMSRPSPMPPRAVGALRRLLADPAQLPIPQVLNAGALSKIVRGDYRGAIIDDVAALEIAVENSFDGLAKGRLPPEIIESLRGLRRFPDLCCKWLPAVGGPRLRDKEWNNIDNARKIRHGVVHRGERATEDQARTVHDACTVGLRRLGMA